MIELVVPFIIALVVLGIIQCMKRSIHPMLKPLSPSILPRNDNDIRQVDNPYFVTNKPKKESRDWFLPKMISFIVISMMIIPVSLIFIAPKYALPNNNEIYDQRERIMNNIITMEEQQTKINHQTKLLLEQIIGNDTGYINRS